MFFSNPILNANYFCGYMGLQTSWCKLFRSRPYNIIVKAGLLPQVLGALNSKIIELSKVNVILALLFTTHFHQVSKRTEKQEINKWSGLLQLVE
ncbi:hypothetical protein EGR_10068 [Echinococcus granulosus]|uniref:Uncharacterized protein n=1 Tax=Echinococcus granulosus TaxID=6210 RepID=W6U3E1_ECHGR|nr:hypothetical protein EGR_10068 [Echinococcus granulosus]EUB55071.1 hypothetical protein EGR_10068 [Echinococcus granulosus]